MSGVPRTAFQRFPSFRRGQPCCRRRQYVLSTSSRRASISRLVNARCTPHVHRLDSTSRFFLARSLHRGPMHRHDATWCSDFAMSGMRRHYACAPCTLLGTAGSVMSLDDDLTIVCGDLTETCGPRSLPVFLFLFLSRSHLAFFFLSSCRGDT